MYPNTWSGICTCCYNINMLPKKWSLKLFDQQMSRYKFCPLLIRTAASCFHQLTSYKCIYCSRVCARFILSFNTFGQNFLLWIKVLYFLYKVLAIIRDGKLQPAMVCFSTSTSLRLIHCTHSNSLALQTAKDYCCGSRQRQRGAMRFRSFKYFALVKYL